MTDIKNHFSIIGCLSNEMLGKLIIDSRAGSHVPPKSFLSPRTWHKVTGAGLDMYALTYKNNNGGDKRTYVHELTIPDLDKNDLLGLGDSAEFGGRRKPTKKQTNKNIK